MDDKEIILMNRPFHQVLCFHGWLLPMNGLQDGTPYAGRPVGNSPEFMSLDHSLNRDIFHSLRFHCVLSRSLL